ncbi:MAG: DMT family transporter, partial [Syntrophothermus sp.]
TKIALRDISPSAIILLRLILAVVLLAGIAHFSGRSFRMNLKFYKNIALLAAIAVFHLWVQVTGLKFTSAANTGWIIGFTPVFMSLIGVIFFKESLNLIKVSGIFISFAGLLLLISKADPGNISLISNKGDFMVLASSFTWSIYSAVNKKAAADFSPLMVTLYQFAIMALLIAPAVLDVPTITNILHMSLDSVLAVVFLGIFCSGIAYVFWAQALQEMESIKVGAFLYVEPFVTVLTAWIFLNEDISLLTIISGIIITAGVVLVNYRFRRLSFKSN